MKALILIALLVVALSGCGKDATVGGGMSNPSANGPHCASVAGEYSWTNPSFPSEKLTMPFSPDCTMFDNGVAVGSIDHSVFDTITLTFTSGTFPSGTYTCTFAYASSTDTNNYTITCPSEIGTFSSGPLH